ncbi:MAG: response regulator [Lachnoclostridium sp.]
MRIVIVEDEIKIREGMGKMIESQTGHMVVGEAADGEEGLEMVLRFKPDLVITDIRMPRMSGLQMLKELAERKVRTHIVILTGYSDFEYAQKAIRYGADDYLLKPLAIEDVRKMLKDIEAKIQEEDAFGYGNQENRLRDILFGNAEETEGTIEELRRVCGFEPEMKYDFMAGYIGSAQPAYKECVEKEINADLGKDYKDFKIYLLYQENRQIFFCLTVGKAEDKEEKVRYERTFFNQVVGKYQKKEERFVWAKVDCTEYNLQEARKHLEKNLSYALVMESDGWITDEMVCEYKAVPFEYPLEIGHRLKNAVCKGRE